jgi:hypothetical protein
MVMHAGHFAGVGLTIGTLLLLELELAGVLFNPNSNCSISACNNGIWNVVNTILT